jgi:hypothetical protein
VLCTTYHLLSENFWINLTNHTDDNDLINSVFTHMHVICIDTYESFQATCSWITDLLNAFFPQIQLGLHAFFFILLILPYCSAN